MNTLFGAFVLLAAMPLAGQWLTYPTPGIPRLPDRSPNLSAKAPKLAGGQAVQMTPWIEGIAQQHASRNQVDDPCGYCLPPGEPRVDLGGGPFKILQTSGVTAILYYETLAGMIFRQVFTDGRPPAQVDSRGFRDGGWIDTAKARPSRDALHVIKRFRGVAFGDMLLSLTIDDPKANLASWTLAFWTMETTLTRMPDIELMEAFRGRARLTRS